MILYYIIQDYENVLCFIEMSTFNAYIYWIYCSVDYDDLLPLMCVTLHRERVREWSPYSTLHDDGDPCCTVTPMYQMPLSYLMMKILQIYYCIHTPLTRQMHWHHLTLLHSSLSSPWLLWFLLYRWNFNENNTHITESSSNLIPVSPHCFPPRHLTASSCTLYRTISKGSLVSLSHSTPLYLSLHCALVILKEIPEKDEYTLLTCASHVLT